MQPNSVGVVPLPVPALAVLSVTTQTLVQQTRLVVHLAQVFVHVPRGLAHPPRAYPPLELRAALPPYYALDPTHVLLLSTSSELISRERLGLPRVTRLLRFRKPWRRFSPPYPRGRRP